MKKEFFSSVQDGEKLELMRHSFSHVMAAAVKELWPKVKFAIGPAIENGFYYDFDFREGKIGEEDLVKIEKKMAEIIKKDLPLEKRKISTKDAIKKEKDLDQNFKVELIEDLEKEGEKIVSYYKLGDFEDLCRGPHVKSSGELNPKAFKLNKLAGAYWRGDEKNKMLTRIYGLAFEDKKELDDYLKMMEEAEKRDHRKLGKELGLFSLHDEGPGFPFWHAKGSILYKELEKFIREENSKRNYNEIKTPIILNKDLWVRSGHWDKFKENMYFTNIDKNEYAVKPMNCPGGLLIYNSEPHSYRELPIRNAELGLVHRHELSGVLYGLFRVRAFTQDDAHSLCSQEMLNSEIIDMVQFAKDVYSSLGFNEYEVFIATRPEKYIGSEEVWRKATEALKNALEHEGIKYEIKEGEGAFYGPKIEFNIKDCLGRNWQCGTIQVDYSMPERFGAEYTDKDGKEKTPIMVHRAILGSLERMLGILIEHYAGAFPVWLSPVQVKLVAVSEKHAEYCQKLAQEIKDEDIRVAVDSSDETVGNKIRKAVGEKVPYMLVVGDREISSEKLAVRDRGSDKVREIDKKDFIEEIKQKNINKD